MIFGAILSRAETLLYQRHISDYSSGLSALYSLAPREAARMARPLIQTCTAVRNIVDETCTAIWESFNMKHMPIPTTEVLSKCSTKH